MNKKMKGFLITMLVVALFLVVACRRTETPPTTETPQEPPKAEQKIDEALTDQVKEEAGVSAGRVYEQGDYVIGTMAIEEGVSQEEIDQLAEKYAQAIKKKYPNKKVNVQAIQGNENVANVTLE